MNGQAITKRYEVRDAETGEPVNGAFVLRPEDDQYAETCMFAYAALCGLGFPFNRVLAAQADPQSGEGREVLDGLAAEIKPPERDDQACESTDGASFLGQAGVGLGSDGTIEYVYNLWRSFGFEPVSVVMRRISEAEEGKANEWIEGKQARHQDRLHEARQLAAEQAKARGIDPEATVVVVQREAPPLAPSDVSVFPARAKTGL